MSGSWKVRLSMYLLFSFLALGIGAHPALADTIYDFTAMSNNLGVVQNFILQYVDTNNDGRVELDEIIPGTFSGVWTISPYIDWKTSLESVPAYDPSYSPYTNGVNDYWVFGDGVFGDANLSASLFTYTQTPEVPIPPSVFLLSAGLIPLAWARRKKRLG
jgi:hypothetical protein